MSTSQKKTGLNMHQSATTLVRKGLLPAQEPLSPEQMQHMLHDLQMQKIELEMQNAELIRTQHEMEVLHASHSEKALRKNKALFDNLVSRASVGIYLLRTKPDETFSLDYVSPKMAEMLNVSVESLLADDMGVIKAIHPDDLDSFTTLNLEGIQKLQPFNWEGRFLVDGKVKWLQFKSSPEPLENGDVIWQGIVADITDRKMSEEELLKSEAKYRYIFDSACDAIFIHDTEARMLAVNSKACEQLGYTHDELMLLWVDKVETPEEFQHAPERLARLLKQGTHSFETVHRRKDGSLIPTEVSAQLIVWDGQPAILSICRDITERKRAEEALRESDERRRALFTRASDGISILSTDGRLHEVNESFALMHGYRPEEMQQMSLDDLNTPETSRLTPERISRLLTGETLKCEVEHYHKDGHVFPLEVSASLIFSGGESFIQSFIRDITERKKAEEERQLLEQQFHNAQKLESLGVLAGGIAHDFNNLLQSILGNMEMAAQELAPGSAPQKHITNAMISGKHAAHLTSLMMSYAGKGLIFKKEMNLNDLVRENTEMLRIAATAAVSMELHLSADLPSILADTAQIQQVVMNLITNAAESFEEKPGIVTLTTCFENCDQTFLAGSLLDEKPEPGRFVFLEVGDNGCGMSKETLKRIFDPFFTTKFSGRGLGMSAVMGIIKSHCGALFVESEPGKGTTFRVLFPVPESAPSATVKQPMTPEGEKHTIPAYPLSGVALVVDDEKSVLKICTKMVTLCGFTVITACDGFDAVTKFREHADEIVVVLMDLTMPKMDGISAMDQIYRIRPDVKVILASGFNEEELSERITNQVPSGFVRKPYSMNMLEAELRRVVQAETHPL